MENIAINSVVVCNDGARYRVVEELRSGGQGRTYLVCNETSGEVFVFKLLSDRDPKRLKRKIENIRHLKDDAPNLMRQLRTRDFSVALPVSLYDKRDTFGYVMPKCDGKELNDLMLEKRFEHMPAEERERIAVRVADAMDWFRRAGYCYQDISHKNVMYEANGAGGTVSIIDCDNVSAERNVTEIVGGTSFFVAPEIAFEGCGHSINTDQYSLAVLLFKIMTGSTDSPYHGKKLYSKHPKPADMFDAADLYQDDPSYGTDWLTFIFDPEDKCNRLDLEIFKSPADRAKHRLILDNWRSVPYEVKELFYRAFRSPLDPIARKKRPNAGEWIAAFANARRGAPKKEQTPTPPPPPPAASGDAGLRLRCYTDEKTFVDLSVQSVLELPLPSGKPFGRVEKQGESYRFTSVCLYTVKYRAQEQQGSLQRGESVELRAGMQLYIPQRPSAKTVVLS